MENRYLSIDCTKIRNNSKQIKTRRNDVMQHITSNNHSRPIVPKPCPQPGRLLKEEALFTWAFRKLFSFLNINKGR